MELDGDNDDDDDDDIVNDATTGSGGGGGGAGRCESSTAIANASAGTGAAAACERLGDAVDVACDGNAPPPPAAPLLADEALRARREPPAAPTSASRSSEYASKARMGSADGHSNGDGDVARGWSGMNPTLDTERREAAVSFERGDECGEDMKRAEERKEGWRCEAGGSARRRNFWETPRNFVRLG